MPSMHPRSRAHQQVPTPTALELVQSHYQPTQAELGEDMRLPEDDGVATLEDLEEMGRALLHPVDITWLGKPKQRTR